MNDAIQRVMPMLEMDYAIEEIKNVTVKMAVEPSLTLCEILGDMQDDLAAMMASMTSSKELNMHQDADITKIDSEIEDSTKELSKLVTPLTSPRELLMMLHKQFNDISDIMLVLQMLLAHHRSWKLDRKMLESAQDLLERDATAEQRHALWAGVNTHALTLHVACLTHISAGQLRSWYRIWSGWENMDIATFFWGLADEVCCHQLGRIFHYICQALRQDMNALHPSRQSDRLSELLGEVIGVTNFTSLIEGTIKLIPENIAAVLHDGNPLANKLLLFVKVALYSPQSMLAQWQQFATCLDVMNFRQRGRFLRDLRAAFQTLSDPFFQQSNDRERLDSRLLQLMDEHWQSTSAERKYVEC